MASTSRKEAVSRLASQVDKQLGGNDHDFFDRLCLVKTTPQNPDASAAVEPGSEVSGHQLWPALKFNSYQELTGQINLIKGVKTGPIKAKTCVEYTRCRRENPELKDPKQHGIAYLFGKEAGVVLVPKTNSEDGEGTVEIDDVYMFDFFSHLIEMEETEGYCGTLEFQSALKLVLRRVETSMNGDDGPSDGYAKSVFSPVKRKKEKPDTTTPVRVKREKTATMTTVTSARKAFSTSAQKTYSNVELSPVFQNKKRAESMQEDELKLVAEKRAPSRRKKSARKSREEDGESLCFEDEVLPVKNVELSEVDHTSLLSSPEKDSPDKKMRSKQKSLQDNEPQEDHPNEADEASRNTEETPSDNLITRRVQRSSPASDANVSWAEMYTKMTKVDGWAYLTGGGLIEWIYVHPTCAHMKKTELLKTKKKNEDYFESEDELKKYARLCLGWRTEDMALSADSPKDNEMADRIKKRKRGVQVQAEVAKPVPVKVAVKPKAKAAEKSKAVKGKKQVNVPKAKKVVKTVQSKPKPHHSEEASSPESQEWEESSEGSSFSKVSEDVSMSKRTRSNLDLSPTLSEAEADIGVRQSIKKKQPNQKLKYADEEEESEYSADSAPESESGEGQSASSNSTSGSEKSSGTGTNSDSTSPSEESSLDATYQVMKSIDAWKLLMERFGFSYSSNKYCLPGNENKPGKDSAAVEGMNYFGTLAELRKHLCAYGLPELKQNEGLDEDETIDIARWVRYANVSGLADAAFINPAEIGEYLDSRKAWTMLKKLGIRFGTSYMVPHYLGPSEPDFRFERQEDYSIHLARFGVPRVEGIQQNEVLSQEDRLKLDLYLSTTEVDTFKRINPGSGDAHEISPRRPRRGGAQSSGNERHLAAQVGPIANGSDSFKQTTKHRNYMVEFNEIRENIQRTFPSQLMSSDEALSTLVDNYNFRILERDGDEYFCLPNVGLTENEDSLLGRDYFETTLDMRENLCAFGLPPMAKGSKLSEAQIQGLEYWVRCANIAGHCEEPVAIPECVDMKPSTARSILKQLGYRLSSNVNSVVLPGVSFHDSTQGIDRFDKLMDLFNHIARFGLAASKPGDDVSESEKEQRLQLDVFIASTATFDVCIRRKCNAPIRKLSLAVKQEKTTEVAPLTADALNTAKHVAQEAVTKSNISNTPIQQPAVVDPEGDQDTPQPSPPKKSKPNTVLNYFTNAGNAVVDKASDAAAAVGDAVAGTFSSPKPPRSRSMSSPMSDISASCLDQEGDEVVEACFADSPQRNASARVLGDVQQYLEDEPSTPTNQMAIDDNMSGPENSMASMHYPQADHANMEWKALWSQMRAAGWTYITGDSLVAWYWVHPEAAKLKKAEMKRECEEGVHYFSTERDIHKYAMENLGWAGDQVGESTPVQSDMPMTSRVKKRKQANDAVKLGVVLNQLKRTRSLTEGTDSQADSSPQQPSPTTEPRTPTRTEKTQELTKACPAKRPAAPKDISGKASPLTVKKEYHALPDKENVVRDKFELCQMVLHPSFKKNQLSKSSSATSVVSSMEEDIMDFMTKSIETGSTVDGMTLPSPGFLYICGGPGTGKTTAVTSCSDEMTKWAKCNGYDKPRFCFINMAATSSTCKGGIMRATLKKIAKSLEIDGASTLLAFEKQFKNKAVVLVLDEIDMMFKQLGGIAETWFQTLVDWAEDKQMRFSMIGISNCVNDINATRIRELGHSPRELVFSAYKEEDILAILEQRLGKNVVDPKALQLISRRVAASTGDARRALEITSNAVGKCADSLTDDKLDMTVEANDKCMPLVKLPHMMRAIREAMPMRHVDVIGTLPQAAKVILCIAVSLSQVWGPTAEISMSTLKSYCIQATHHSIMDELGVGQIMNLCVMLIDSGLLLTGNSGNFDPHNANSKLKIGVQLDDVEIALEQSLLKEGGFYQGLVNYVKRECPRGSNP